MRLNKFLSASGVCSRRKADELIENGEIIVNGKVETQLGTNIDEKKDKIIVFISYLIFNIYSIH